MALKPGPKPIAKSTGKPDQRRRDNKDTPGNNPALKPSKSTGKKQCFGVFSAGCRQSIVGFWRYFDGFEFPIIVMSISATVSGQTMRLYAIICERMRFYAIICERMRLYAIARP